MPLMDDHLSTALAESWKAYLPEHRANVDGEDMPVVEQLHIAHVAGFNSGLVAAGLPPLIVELLSRREFERVQREGLTDA